LQLNQAATIDAPIGLNRSGVLDFNGLMLAYRALLLPPG